MSNICHNTSHNAELRSKTRLNIHRITKDGNAINRHYSQILYSYQINLATAATDIWTVV